MWRAGCGLRGSVTFALIGLLLLCSPCPPAFGREQEALPPITRVQIGVILPLSGPGEGLGQRALRGIQYAFEEAPDSGAELDIQLIVRDTTGDPFTAARMVQQMADRGDVEVILGPAFTEGASAAASVAERVGIPLLSPTAAGETVPGAGEFFFRNALTTGLQVKGLLDYAVGRLGLSRFVILYPSAPLWEGMKDRFLAASASRGAEVYRTVPFDPGATDFGEPLRALGGNEQFPVGRDARGRPHVPYDAFFVPSPAETGGLLAAQIAFYNLDGLPILGGSTWHSPRLIQVGGHFAEGIVFVDGFFAGSSRQDVRNFVEGFQRRFGEEPDVVAAQAYDAGRILLLLLEQGVTERRALREALGKVANFPGVTGRTTLGPRGWVDKDVFVLTVRDGKIVELR